MLIADIPTQILLTILLSIDHSSRFKLKIYIITYTKEEPSKIGKAMKVERV